MQLTDKSKKNLVVAYVLFLIFISAIRLLNNDFWGDECWSILLGRMDIKDLIFATSWDVHPPLYYLILKLLITLFGDNYFVYNVSCFIPYLLLVLFGYKIIFKNVGLVQYLIYVTLLTISNMSLMYNHQVRMYSWASLLLVMAFYEMLKVLKKGKSINYILFGVYSVLAAYTHYYSLVAVSFFYFFIIIINIIKKNDFWKTVMLIGVSILGYLPWLMILIQTFVRTSDNYWMKRIPTLYSSIKWTFELSNNFFTNIVIAMYFLYFCYSIKNIIEKIRKKEVIHDIKFDFINILFCTSFLGTIFIGIIVSYVVRPLYEERFLYQFVPLLWMLIGYIIVDLYKKVNRKCLRKIIVIFISLMIGSQYIYYYSKVITELNNCINFNKTLSDMKNYINDDTILLTDEFLYEWTVLECYFPNNEIKNIAEANITQLKNTMLVINAYSDDLKEELKNHTNIRMIEEQGYLGEVHNTIYYVD